MVLSRSAEGGTALGTARSGHQTCGLTSPGNWSDMWAPPRSTESETLGGFNKPPGGFQCLLKFENTGDLALGSEGSEFRSHGCP